MNRLAAIIIVLLVFVVTPGVISSTSAQGYDVSSNRYGEADGHHHVPEFEAGELIVKFREGSKEHERRRSHAKRRSRILKQHRLTRFDHVKISPLLTMNEALDAYRSDPAVEFVEPNYIVYAEDGWEEVDEEAILPNDPDFPVLWNLHNEGQTGGTPMADVDVLRAWANSTGSSDVVVAVIDSGVDYTHEDLSDNMWQNEIELNGVPGFDDDGNGYVDDVYGINTFDGTNDPMDELGHGTHIAGVIGATGNNGIGVVGLNWNIRILPCRFMNAAGSGRISGAVECLEYVSALKSRGVNIIATNNSWGGSGYSQTLYEAIREQPDILFVTAAGNHARDNDSNFFMPVNIDLPNVMAIASTDHNDAKTSTSGFGRQTVHLGAPGSSIFSTLPANTYWGDQYYGYLSGTSIAAPHVTGLAALVSARWPDARWQEIRNRILAGGDRVDSLAHNTITGRRANAYGALECEEQRVFSVLRAPNEYVAGMSALLRVLSIQCAKAKGRVTMTTASGEAVRLRDDGIFPDLAYSDGIYSAEWVPARPFGKMTFTSGIGKEVVITDTPVIISQSLRHATAGIPYSETVQAEGGLEPYGWEVGDGELPPGLNLNHDTGQIQGVPGQAGDFTFTLRLTDSGLRSSTAAFHLVVQQPANTLRILKAHYFARKGLLYIRVQSRHNEFANLEVEGLGPMRWNSRAKLWDMRITSLRPELAPRMVTVRGIEGTRSRRVMWVPRGRMFTKTVIQRN